MDHFEIAQSIRNGAILEIYRQTKTNPDATAWIDGERVSVSQAERAIRLAGIKKIGGYSEWSSYGRA
jgi:hypothetical protein